MSKKCQNCGFELTEKMNFCPQCHAKYIAAPAAEKTPVEWVNEFFADRVAELRKKKFGGLFGGYIFAFVATDTPCEFGLTPAAFNKTLAKLELNEFAEPAESGDWIDYDRCIMVFDNQAATWGKNTMGGVITLDGIWYSCTEKLATTVRYYKKWEEIGSIVQKHDIWKEDFIELDGVYVIIKAMEDSYLGKDDFAKFLSALSGKQVIRG